MALQTKHLDLPASLEVERDLEEESALYDRVKAWLERDERQPGIHASGLLFPRKTYWRQLDPLPLNEREVGMFMVGRVLHSFILGHADLSADEGSTYSEELGLWYSPDERKPVAEIKTSRSHYEPKTLADLETYLHQLLIYMVAEGTTEGFLKVLYLNAKDDTGRTSPSFRVFRVKISEEELVAHRLVLRKLRDDISDAVVKKDHRSLPLCPEWLCSPKECPYWAKCQPQGRYENNAYLKGKKK